jgi:hypothetical protein
MAKLIGGTQTIENSLNVNGDITCVNLYVTNPISEVSISSIIGNLTITGNLTVTGTTTTFQTETIIIEDNILLLNSTQTGTPLSTLTSGIEVERGDETNLKIKRHPSASGGVSGSRRDLEMLSRFYRDQHDDKRMTSLSSEYVLF